MYRCEFTDARQFIRQLRLHCIARGYRFYVTGTIPAHKDPAKTDQKIIRQYGIDISKWARGRRKKLGLANLHYLRHGCFFVIIATRGTHEFFLEEYSVQDIRRKPLLCLGPRLRASSRRQRCLRAKERSHLLLRAGGEDGKPASHLKCRADNPK